MIELIFTETLPNLWAAAVASGVIHGLAATYLLWLFYLAVMNLKRARDNGTLSKVALFLGSPILIVGYLLDWFVNVTVMTIVFLELPQEKMVTHRLRRHVRHGSGYRKKLAWFICHHLLDTFDPSGKHC